MLDGEEACLSGVRRLIRRREVRGYVLVEGGRPWVEALDPLEPAAPHDGPHADARMTRAVHGLAHILVGNATGDRA